MRELDTETMIRRTISRFLSRKAAGDGMDQRAEGKNTGRRFSLTRYSMYNSLESFVSSHGYHGDILLISERNELSMRSMFRDGSTFTPTRYPETDIMDLSSYADETYDVIISDQVLEHVPAPWTALEQMRKKLKPGGIAINTSCTFNPIHDEPDFYRFTPDGFGYLHEACVGKVLLLDYWGNRKAISDFAAFDRKCFDVRSDPYALELATQKDALWPWVVWCIAQRIP